MEAHGILRQEITLINPKDIQKFVGKSKPDTKDDYPRGSAGTVFLNDKSRIIKIKDAKLGISDDPSFYKFDIKRPKTPYLSFILFPIHWKKNVIGVLTIEGKEQDTFDFENPIWLQGIADLLGTILFLFKKVK